MTYIIIGLNPSHDDGEQLAVPVDALSELFGYAARVAPTILTREEYGNCFTYDETPGCSEATCRVLADALDTPVPPCSVCHGDSSVRADRLRRRRREHFARPTPCAHPMGLHLRQMRTFIRLLRTCGGCRLD
jgi:hypothetical protein